MVRVLTRRGMEFQEQRPSTGRQLTRPDTGRSHISTTRPASSSLENLAQPAVLPPFGLLGALDHANLTPKPPSSNSSTVERPGTAVSGPQSSKQRPSSSSLALPPLPKPSVAGQSSSQSSDVWDRGVASSRPSTSSPLKRSFADSVGGVSQAPSRFPERSIDRNGEPLSSMSRHNDERTVPRGILNEVSANAKVPRLRSLADAPYELESPPTSSTRPHNKSLPDDRPADSQFISAPHAKSLPDDRPAHSQAISVPHASRHVDRNPDVVCDENLNQYAAGAQADREAALDDFMVRNLESPAFARLCEDVERCWRRIALGL